jgi:threonine/homoserine/homoserine lactone efflux protein
VDNLLGVLVGIAVFGFITSVTPGPNNTFLLTSGMNHGLKKSLSYINGIMIGLTGMFTAISLGIGALFRAFPVIQEVLKYVGFAYILFMAYGIIRSTFVHKHEETQPTGFVRSALFQLVNPKAWIVVISFYASYIPESPDFGTLVAALVVFLASTYPGAMIWAAFGEAVSGILQKPQTRRIFNVSAATLLVISMVPVLFLQ